MRVPSLLRRIVPVVVTACGFALTARADSASATSAPTTLLPPGTTDRELTAYLRKLTPKFHLPADADAWNARAAELREQILKKVVYRGVPESWTAGPVKIVWQGVIKGDGYSIQKLRYEVVPGLWAGALLYEPIKLAGKAPALLHLNGHVGAPGTTIDYKQALSINLAKRGMIVLSPEWINMGQLARPGYGHNESALLDLCGRAGLAVFYQSLKRGLDVLEENPGVDPKRIAVTGLSGGGWQTIVISALDTRVALSAPNAGYIGFGVRVENRGDIGDLEQNPTDLIVMADYVDLTAMLAPRPALLIYNEKDDCCFASARANTSVFEPIIPVYKLFNAEGRFAFHDNRDPGTHNYLLDNRQAFYRFINRHLLTEEAKQNLEIPVDNEIRTQQELSIDYPADNADFFTLAAQAAADLPRGPAPAGEGEALKSWRTTTRALLRRIVRPDPVQPFVATPTSPTTGGLPPAISTCTLSNGEWTLPVTEHRSGGEPREVVIILADDGAKTIGPAAVAAAAAGKHVFTADLLLIGECLTTSPPQSAMLIATAGRRPLGIQVSQFNALLSWVGVNVSDRPIRVVTHGRIVGLAVLTACALEPRHKLDLELNGLDDSFGSMIRDKITYGRGPSIFCFGLFELLDIPDLIRLAESATVTRGK